MLRSLSLARKLHGRQQSTRLGSVVRARNAAYFSSTSNLSSSSSSDGSSGSGGGGRIDPEDVDPAEMQDVLAKKEAAQVQFLEKLKGKEGKEMPPDLIAFIRDADPVKEVPSNQLVTPTRMPRYLRGDDDEEEEEEEGGGEAASGEEQPGRRVEEMPLMEKVPEYQTRRTTNFSRQRERVSARIYQAGTVLDLHDMLMKKQEIQIVRIQQEKESGEQTYDDEVNLLDDDTAERLAEETYEEYAKTNELPKLEHQRHHKELLANTFKYLSQPVLMYDPDEAFDGVPVEEADRAVQFFKYTHVPVKRARFVLKDLSEKRLLGEDTEQDKKPRKGNLSYR